MTKKKIISGIVIIALAASGWWIFARNGKPQEKKVKPVTVTYGSIKNFVSSTGNVQPQNRLSIKAPIGGRIEKILVKEGQHIKTGQILALMSSTERAALMDAALLRGAETVKEWEDVYKPTPLLAPLDGEVIVKAVNPGQTVTPSDDVIVLSDRLIVQAQVDETDIGKIKIAQKALISLDAYPDIEVEGEVDHIYYESKIVNNVTTYSVDIVTDKLPELFRSGMTANIQIIKDEKDHVLILPREAVQKKDKKSFVLVQQEGERKPSRQDIEVGLSDDTNVEIVSGLSEEDQVIIPSAKSKFNANKRSASSPFMPTGGGGRGR